MADILQTTLSCAFSWMKIYEFRLVFHWGLFLRVQLIITHHLVRIMAWRRPDDKPLSEPIMVSFLTHMCIIRPQGVKHWHWSNFTMSESLSEPFAVPPRPIHTIHDMGVYLDLEKFKPSHCLFCWEKIPLWKRSLCHTQSRVTGRGLPCNF